MNTRQEYAKSAMEAILTNPGILERLDIISGEQKERIAKIAFEYADAMVAADSKKPNIGGSAFARLEIKRLLMAHPDGMKLSAIQKLAKDELGISHASFFRAWGQLTIGNGEVDMLDNGKWQVRSGK